MLQTLIQKRTFFTAIGNGCKIRNVQHQPLRPRIRIAPTRRSSYHFSRQFACTAHMATEGTAPIAVIVGCGSKHDKDGTISSMRPEARWGLGGALSLCFAAKGFHVVLMSRRNEIANQVAEEIHKRGGIATPVVCDVTKDDSVAAAFTTAGSLGDIDVVVYNCAPPFPPGFSFGNPNNPHDVDVDYFNLTFDIGVTGCVRVAKQVVPKMLERGKGTLLLSGATMALRGGAAFGALAPSKTALRSYGQSMFQAYGPKGIHVAHVVIDGVIDSPATDGWSKQPMLPESIAEEYYKLHTQDPCVWSYELMIGPSTGSVGMRM